MEVTSQSVSVVLMVLLGFAESDLQYAQNKFAAGYSKPEMRISVTKSKTCVLSRKSSQHVVNVSGSSLNQVAKFKYFGALLISDEKQEAELDTRIVGDGTIIRRLLHSIPTRGGMAWKTKFPFSLHFSCLPTIAVMNIM